jgi:hypothetical protein
MTGAPVLLLCQMAADMTRMRCALGDLDGDALEGAAAMGFQVDLTLEGVVDSPIR